MLCKLLIIVFILQTFLFISCKDDPVTVKPPSPDDTSSIKDSAMFDWEYVQLFQYTLTDLYVADTNKIFIVANGGLIFYDGKNVTELNINDPQFFADVLAGTSPNNIFIGGSDYHHPANTKLKKWNGASFESVGQFLDTTRHILDIIALNDNNVWVATASNVVYNCNGTETQYSFISQKLLVSPQFYQDVIGQLYLFGYNRTSNNTTDFKFYTYKLENNNKWQQILSDSGDDNSEMRIFLNICGTNAIRGGSTANYNFTGYGWDALQPNLEFKGKVFGGTSKNDFLCAGNVTTSYFFYKMYYYNGNEWFRMSNYLYAGGVETPRRICKVKNNYYGIYTSSEPTNSHLFIARPKND